MTDINPSDILSSTAESTDAAIKSFFEKVLPVMSAIQKNSNFLAAKSALSYVKTDSPTDKAVAKSWVARSESFKNSINTFLSDPSITEEIKAKYKIAED